MKQNLIFGCVGMAVVATGCASTPEILNPTSPYFRPAEGVLYKYANFCGPGTPTRVSEDPMQHLAVLMPLVPQDAIDAACKQHDVCFETEGRDDPACDYAMVGALRYYLNEAFTAEGTMLPSRATQACMNLATEVMSPFATKYSLSNKGRQRADESKSEEQLAAEREAEIQQFWSAITSGDQSQATASTGTEEQTAGSFGLASTIVSSTMAVVSSRFTGWPEEGSCGLITEDAVAAAFACHKNHFDVTIDTTQDLNAVSLEFMENNGCAELVSTQFPTSPPAAAEDAPTAQSQPAAGAR